MLATSNHTITQDQKKKKTVNKNIYYDSQKLVYVYVILRFGSTGKSFPRSMKKNSYFVNLSWLQLDLNLTTK